MNLPDITDTSKDIRLLYFQMISHMANVDQDLDESEIALLRSEVVRLGLTESEGETIIAQGSLDEETIKRGFTSIKEARLEYSFLLDLIFMAMADGLLHDAERVYLAKINDWVSIPRADFHSLVYFAQSSLNVESPEDIDPMVDYMIQNFFRWARQEHVQLYQQTTFALNQEVDQYLKNEL